MPTASIYYRSDNPRVPDFVLINGESAAITTTGTDDPDGVRIIVDQACRAIGWKAADGAPIIRQADGRGTIIITPLSDTLDKATVYINVRRFGQPYRVAVDGRVMLVTTKTSLTSGPPGPAIDVIDGALTQLGYRRVSSLAIDTQPEGDKGGIWVCTAETRPDRMWRDDPTLVRISDDAARALNDMATKLGIPGDTLATAWILHAATEARHHYHEFTAPGGYIEDQSRITGWMPSGQPHLKD